MDRTALESGGGGGGGGGFAERSTPAKTYAAAMCLLKSLERGTPSKTFTQNKEGKP